MNFKNILIGITLSLSTISCIQDEALNVEAAIDGCSGANIQLININEISREIDIFVFEGSNVAAQELNFTSLMGLPSVQTNLKARTIHLTTISALKKSVPSLSHPKMEVTRQLTQLIYIQ